jgi:signal transduction histidine kinase
MPLRIDSEPLGALWIMRREAEPFDADELAGLSRLASQAVIAIEHALMAERLQSLAVTEERGRIAREMHDGLAQILGFLSLEMQTLEALARQGNQPALMSELGAARERIKEAQADVRDNILSLRTTLGDSAGLVSALDQYLQEFSVQANIPVRLVNDLPGEPHLAPLAETQLVRIIQEALANVRKHAHAQQVEVHLARSDGHLDLTVADDGVGMQRTPDRHHFGLQTMQERAASVGGTLLIDSEPGSGTRVLARLPLIER